MIAIFAPFAQEAEALVAMVAQAGRQGLICHSIDELCAEVERHATALLVTDEMLEQPESQSLTDCLRRQPIWSDIPVMVLCGTHGKSGADDRAEFLKRFGNVMALERPITPHALRLSLDAAGRSRAWQFRIRDQMAERDAHSAQLEKRVEERSDALLESRRLEMTGRLTQGMIHDFNNLLQIIDTSATLLRHVMTNVAQTDKLITNIEEATEKASRLTHQLCKFGRRQEPSSGAVNLAEHINDMEQLLRQSLGAKISLELIFESALRQAKVDPVQLDMALIGFAINVKDVMPEGGKVTLSVCNLGSSSARLAFTIGLAREFAWFRENGAGVPQDAAFGPSLTTNELAQRVRLILSPVSEFAKQFGGDTCIEASQEYICISILLPALPH